MQSSSIIKIWLNKLQARFFAVDAHNPSQQLNVHMRSGRNGDNTEFFGFFRFDAEVEAPYALIGLKRLGDHFPSEIETPLLFFVVELGDIFHEGANSHRSIKSYCKMPCQAVNLFNELHTGE